MTSTTNFIHTPKGLKKSMIMQIFTYCIARGKLFALTVVGLVLTVCLLRSYDELWQDDLSVDDSHRPLLSPREDDLHSFPSNHRHLFHIFDPQHHTLPARFRAVDLRADRRHEWTPDTASYTCVLSKTSPSFTICLYPPERDVYISRSLMTSGLWEPYITRAFMTALERFPHATVIDVGANLGYYSLLASAAGHKVVALEPQDENVKRFVAGVRADPWNENILLLANALSDRHRNVSLSESEDNQGGIQVIEKCDHLWSKGGYCTSVTLTLDDLLYVVSTKSAIIKIDIEGYECKALATASHFFSVIKVPYIFMEWRQMTEKRLMPLTVCPASNIDALSHFLSQRGYVPHEIRSGIKLNPYRASTWKIGDVYWRSQELDLLVPSL
ncbi:hypothetical protein Btru_035529 [Bulinus truncatus]|nr:hypothetical protein Btru_035529 [Bulinus truncatus]